MISQACFLSHLLACITRGNFLLNNYEQCLQIIAENTVEVAQLKAELGIEVTAFYDWLKQEKAFLSGLCEPQDEHVLECAYVQALIMCQWAEEKLECVPHDWIVISSHQEPDYSSDAHQTRRIEAALHAAFDGLTLTIQAIGDLEAKLEIDQPVQQLVMQRLLELSKANMSGMGRPYMLCYAGIFLTANTGYKMRASVWKGLKARTKAIRTALKRYNKLTANMQPPAPPLYWKDVVNYTFVSEFELLRSAYSHGDVLSAPWTVPHNHEISAKFFKMLSEQDKLPHLNSEISRLHTSIELEQCEYGHTIKSIAAPNPHLAAELRAAYRLRQRIDQIHLAQLVTIRALPGYTGLSGCGVPMSRSQELFDMTGDDSAMTEDHVAVDTVQVDEDTPDSEDMLEDDAWSAELNMNLRYNFQNCAYGPHSRMHAIHNAKFFQHGYSADTAIFSVHTFSEDINIHIVTTRQFKQNSTLQAVIDKLEKIICPGPGYAFDEESRRIFTHLVQLAPDVCPPTRADEALPLDESRTVVCSPSCATSPVTAHRPPTVCKEARTQSYEAIAQEVIHHAAASQEQCLRVLALPPNSLSVLRLHLEHLWVTSISESMEPTHDDYGVDCGLTSAAVHGFLCLVFAATIGLLNFGWTSTLDAAEDIQWRGIQKDLHQTSPAASGIDIRPGLSSSDEFLQMNPS
ncbi:hypothetical protein NUW54_g4120 [Trametes sanguinea]|uniref:Uncharacterized protein n=1 Tax=Trametes sanguinea TaxID=158606 RepID=A0ACC1Q1M6_9APHY|nr:hypothetical protein NUW54_g4120 [Trametes sanguinea]